MSDCFLGEIRMFSYKNVPAGWVPCEGQSLPIQQNAALFALLGVNFGGDGKTSFKLPDLRGQAPLCIGPANGLGAAGGEAAHVLTVDEMPAHSHPAGASTKAPSVVPLAGNTWAGANNAYANTANVAMSAQATTTAGGGQPHANMQPYLALTFCIAIRGIYPPRD